MKIYIGKYLNYWGPFQIADWLSKFGASEDTCIKVGDKLNKVIGPLCNWIHKKQKRKIKIRIDRYDVWSLDHTLAYIIAPALRELKKDKHGAPFVDDEDVPENIRSTAAPAKENEYDTDKFHFDRWDYVIDEMLFAFEALEKDDEWEDQFHTGVHDTTWAGVDEDGNEVPNEGAKLFKMKEGPNHTAKFDVEGYTVVADRIKNGFRLFGKYYQSLWL